VYNAVVRDGKIPENWSLSWLASMYKGKEDALECGLYRGIEMLVHILKMFERIIEVQGREKIQIDNLQFGFMGGKGTTDFHRLWMAVVALEKAYD